MLWNKPAPKLSMQGQPVHINQAPTAPDAVLRNYTRLCRCHERLQAGNLPQGKEKTLRAEIKRREANLECIGHDVPGDLPALRAVVRKLTGGALDG